MKKYIFWILLLYNVVFAKNIDEIISKALQQNPKLKAIQNELKAYKEREIFVSSLDDPIISFSINDIQFSYKPFIRDLEPMQTINIGISQEIPWLKKLNLRKEVISKIYNKKYFYLKNLKLEMIYSIYKNAFKYWEIEEKLKIIKEYEKVAKHLIEFSNTLYSVGKVSQADALNAQVFYTKLKEREEKLIKEKQAILSKLSYYTSFNVKNITIYPIKPYELKDLENLKKLVLQKNPQIKIFKARIDKRNKELKLAKSEYKPDFKFFANYSYRQGFKDYVSLGVSFNLPVWKKYRQNKKVLEMAYFKSKEERLYKDVKNKIISQLEESFYNANSYYDSYKIFDGYLLFQSQKVYESVISEYQVGKKNIFDVVKALNQILDVKIKLVELIANFNISYKNIEKLTGEIK
ncbi:TolC family protein [Persephonella sp.]|uniref:TolC family protein n=1 Tax=Persephonella sp. TaxID=2060922 RepID=UPI002624FACE|nr:TolC family protein [Persephonella sp.]